MNSGGVDLRSSVHNVLHRHFNTSELLRLSVPSDMFQAIRMTGGAHATQGIGSSGNGILMPCLRGMPTGSVLPDGSAFTPAAVPTISEEETSKISGGSNHVTDGTGLQER